MKRSIYQLNQGQFKGLQFNEQYNLEMKLWIESNLFDENKKDENLYQLLVQLIDQAINELLEDKSSIQDYGYYLGENCRWKFDNKKDYKMNLPYIIECHHEIESFVSFWFQWKVKPHKQVHKSVHGERDKR